MAVCGYDLLMDGPEFSTSGEDHQELNPNDPALTPESAAKKEISASMREAVSAALRLAHSFEREGMSTPDYVDTFLDQVNLGGLTERRAAEALDLAGDLARDQKYSTQALGMDPIDEIVLHPHELEEKRDALEEEEIRHMGASVFLWVAGERLWERIREKQEGQARGIIDAGDGPDQGDKE
jgi:hypothetical protein